MTTLTPAQVERFMRLASALSPENLHMDGECSRAQARRTEHVLRGQWKVLEAQIGRRVSEDEVWAAFLTTQRGR